MDLSTDLRTYISLGGKRPSRERACVFGGGGNL